jgi:sugar lactone lactonase YvrE
MRPRVVLRSLRFPEGPRWHDGALWFSEMHARRVIRTSLDGEASVVLETPEDRPSGIGWLPDGRLLVVAMTTGRLLRLEHDGTVAVHADLSRLAAGSINDMIVAADGTAYVGDMGVRLFATSRDRVPGQTIRVTADGTVSIAAGDLAGPNGHVLTEDGRTLLVAETGGACITAFTVGRDGSLRERRTFARLEPPRGAPRAVPDGMCLDAEGFVWVAEINGRRALRVGEGGEVTDVVNSGRRSPFAVVLGGADRRTLLLCAAASPRPDERKASGRILAVEVAVPGAGRP